MRIGIIGTAGRKDDEPRMSKQLYNRMVMEAMLKIYEHEIVGLISGGAAWSDHIAVSIYLMNFVNVKSLTLHLPAEFDGKEFKGSSSAKTANYYHSLFSKKMGGNTLLGIEKARAIGANLITYNDFKTRNLAIAEESDILIAFTFNNDDQPKPKSGTLHTWNNSKAFKKIHVNLFDLM